MAEPRRHRRNVNEPGHAHELTFGCYRGFPLLQSDRTCGWLAESVEQSREEHDFDLWAYVFMPNHVHLVIRPRRETYDIAEIRSAIKEPVGRNAFRWLRTNAPEWIPRLTRRRGRREERLFWQSGGGYDRNITESRTLASMIDYVHLNPVRKGLAERPADWRWSSAAWHADGTAVPIRVDPIPPEWAGTSEP